MYYVYVLRCYADDNLYFGCAKDLRERVAKHSAGSVKSTKRRLPVELIYYEVAKIRKMPITARNILRALMGTDISEIGTVIISRAKARRSLFEDASMLLVFERLQLLKEVETDQLLWDCDTLSRGITNFSRSL